MLQPDDIYIFLQALTTIDLGDMRETAAADTSRCLGTDASTVLVTNIIINVQKEYKHSHPA